MKKALVILTFCLAGWFANYRLDGFDLAKIYSPLQDQKQWEVAKLDLWQRESIDLMLDQKFYYLSRGHQCFVFVSEDGKYVLKLINHARFGLPRYLNLFSFISPIRKLQEKRLQRLEPSFQSFRLAYRDLKEETGLIFLQLNKNNHFHKSVTLVDKINIEHKIDIDRVEFMIQRKGDMIYPSLGRVWNEKDDAPFKQALVSFAKIIQKRCRKSIADDDLDVEINYGFIEGQAILIDPGRLCVDTSLSDEKQRKKELLKSTKQFRKWLKNRYPKYVSFFKKALLTPEESSGEAL